MRATSEHKQQSLPFYAPGALSTRRAPEAPLSPSQLEELRWYVEEYMDLPVGGYVVTERMLEIFKASGQKKPVGGGQH